ncbi:HPF/RaiA family ribosome-associated protein [Aquisalimonas sp.]|uniref:HPF/RaiA family ribosome-associated protein n=1 Tax=Aquisalimonas sp. TaxID=1872621 RepID=UPI0025B9A01B|nr:HPF/RaiA family ribosome-associated protein [Aquisalimonas sp.]
MHLQINPAQGVTVSEALEAHLRQRLETIERRFGDRLTRIEAYFTDVNGPKGGINKQCKLEARPRGLDPVAAEHLSENAYDAASGAADRLEKVLDKRFGKLENRP